MAFSTSLIVPELLQQLVTAKIPDTLELQRRGLGRMEFQPQIAGHVFQFRQWNPVTGDAEVNDGTDSSNTTRLTQFAETGVVIRRKKVMELTDAEVKIAQGMGAEAFTRQLAEQLIPYWPKQFERLAVVILKALFGSGGCLATTHKKGYTVKMDRSKALAAKHVLGDNAGELRAMFVNSKVAYDIENEGLVEYLDQISGITATGRVPTYLGMGLWQDDTMPHSGSGATSLYQSYLLAENALCFAMALDPTVYEQVNAKGPTVLLTQTADIVIHLRGTKYVGTTFPADDSELATVGNWQKADSVDRNIRAACIETYSSLDA